MLQVTKQLTLALLKPDICANAALPPKIKEAIINQGLEIIKKFYCLPRISTRFKRFYRFQKFLLAKQKT